MTLRMRYLIHSLLPLLTLRGLGILRTGALMFAFTLSVFSAHAQTITLVGEDDWYPYSAQKDGKLRGFAVEVIEAAYASVDVTVNFKSAPYARCLMLVETGQELGCFDSLKDSKLSAEFLFHQEPIFKAEIGIYGLITSEESGLRASDMSGRKVGLTHGYTYTDAIDKDSSIQREEAPTDLSNLRKLLLKRSEYSLVYTRIVDYLVHRYPQEFKGKIKQVGTINVDRLYVSFSKKREESAKYAALLDQGLRKIKSNGQYAKIEQRWQVPAP
ncbi:transporter substrate-binding domain-containing protein [Undibacterium sp. LX40W]|uniref:Transporter substrate-binding domain-containing protein n=1 Tax=Undibacterium nitidum TaxID=2762298 RepID=A0A923KRZ6_9BURK|nr:MULTISPECIES: transporter substrate-binding domain-containing protein [Undibacterium]MBC3880741.1 transporter substrate-binding domain-containing protein [Undibacterium nitidum]MBC3890524.1 transporter substrate-binding domain-containing protein [Undibacterium sp. LX40W]